MTDVRDARVLWVEVTGPEPWWQKCKQMHFDG